MRSYYVVLSSFGLDHWGRYLDEFGVVDGEWLITKRTVTTEGVDPDGMGRGASGPADQAGERAAGDHEHDAR